MLFWLCRKDFSVGIWHVTFVTYFSRITERMLECRVKFKDGVCLDSDGELIVTKSIAQTVLADNLLLYAFNICFDHVHLVMEINRSELPSVIGKIKSISSRTYNIAIGMTVPGLYPFDKETSSKQKHGMTQNHLWARKFHVVPILSNRQLGKTINYVRNNRKKHGLEESQELQKTIDSFINVVSIHNDKFK